MPGQRRGKRRYVCGSTGNPLKDHLNQTEITKNTMVNPIATLSSVLKKTLNHKAPDVSRLSDQNLYLLCLLLALGTLSTHK